VEVAGFEAEKPLNLVAEGLLSENSRDDKTPLELFLAGTRALALDSHFSDTLKVIARAE
jgi:hypothetical protein